MNTCDDLDNIFYVAALLLSFFFIYIAFKRIPLPSLGNVPKRGVEQGAARANPAADEILSKLIENGATFYGASWCGFTKKQLAELKITETDSKGLDYVDCETQEEHCQSKGIDAFPTWQINGQMYPGYYPIEKLSELLRTKQVS